MGAVYPDGNLDKPLPTTLLFGVTVMSELNSTRLKEILKYNPDTGIFTWLNDMGRRIKLGQQAGCLHHSGYVQIRIDKKTIPHIVLLGFTFMIVGLKKLLITSAALKQRTKSRTCEKLQLLKIVKTDTKQEVSQATLACLLTQTEKIAGNLQ
jgi:hypothetical protein